MTPEEVRQEIDRLLGSIGLDTAPWAQQLLKSTHSKNIDISEWNTFILKVAEVAASASALQRVSELLALDLDTNLHDGDYEKAPGAIYQESSEALSPYAAGLGHDCVAGGKGYKIVGIILSDYTVVDYPSTDNSTRGVAGYKLQTVEGLAPGLTYSVRLESAAYHCGTIKSISGKNIFVNNAPSIKGFNTNDDDPENGFVANVLTIKGRPDLGDVDVDVGFNAFTEGKGNYASEANAHAEGTGNYALGKASHAEGNGNVTGYEAHAEGRGNQALGEQSHAEGNANKVTGGSSHAEGYSNTASGASSHAGGRYSNARGDNSFAHGQYANANGKNAAAFGMATSAPNGNQFSAGRYNRSPEGTLFTIGNGTGETTRSNALEVYEDGHAVVQGTTTVSSPTATVHAVNGVTLHKYLGIDGTKTNSLVFEYNDGFAMVGDNTGINFSSVETIHIPSVVSGYPVYGLKQGAFYANTYVKKVMMHKGLSKVGIEAFNACRNLSYLSLADTIQEIGRHAFNNTLLTQLSLPRDIIYIGRVAFNGAPIKNTIVIPQSCKYIGYMSDETNGEGGGNVFTSKKIPAIIFEGKPLRIHANAFNGCECDIFVPWSEGEVAKPNDSAWGSTGTVHYNYNPTEGVGSSFEIVQETGESTEAVMSQHAVSTELEDLGEELISIDTQIWSDLEPRIAALENSTPDSISTAVPLYRHCLDIHFNGNLDTFSDTVELHMFCSIITSYGAPFEDLTDDPEYSLGAQTHPATGCVICGGVCSPIVYFKGAHHPDGTGLGHVLIGCVRYREADGIAVGIEELEIHPSDFAEYTDTVVDTNVEV